VLFHHRDVNPGAGQQQAEHHAGGAAAGDEAGRPVGGSHGEILAHGRLVGRTLALAAGAA
jgi:hypothetical protein